MTDGKHNMECAIVKPFRTDRSLGAILRIHAENDQFYISSDNDDRRGLSLI